jgi:hypothetical protein
MFKEVVRHAQEFESQLHVTSGSHHLKKPVDENARISRRIPFNEMLIKNANIPTDET